MKYKASLHIIIIVLLGLLAYSNTFDVPFVFDDIPNTTESPFIKDISNVPAYFTGLRGPWASRPLMHATLAINYYMGGFDTWGYHALNLGVHILNGILLYFLVVMTGRQLSYGEKETRFVAAFSSLLFVVHPVQTQAVTYIVSRSMLFATTFYLSGLILFLKAVTSDKRRGLCIAGLFLVSLFGMASRENFATFPLMLFLYDLFFISGFRPREALQHWKAYLPVLMSLGYVAYLVLGNTYDRGTDFPGIGVSNLEYFFTQFNIHWTYLRLLVLPVGQHLDYDYPIAKTFFEFPTILSFLGYLALWAAALALSRKRPVVSFSMLWFLITLLPISFLVAFMDLRLGDVMVEHRLYLPSVGVFVAITSGAVIIAERHGGLRKIVQAALVLICIVFSITAYLRNATWESSTSLWEDAVRKSPANVRAHFNLGHEYFRQGMTSDAIEHLSIASDLSPYDANIRSNLGIAYDYNGQADRAIEQYLIAIEQDPNQPETHNNLGIAYRTKGMTDKAVEHYLIALELEPDMPMAHFNLGAAYWDRGLDGKAIEHLRAAARLDPDDPDAHYYLGLAYRGRGMVEKAEVHLKTALRLRPEHREARLALESIQSERLR